jgi:mannan endo-1,4-beta-mannosidase
MTTFMRIFLLIVITAFCAGAYDLIDPKADARTVAVWNYLQSQYGKKMLSGCWTEQQYGGAQAFHTCSGQWPAIWGQDMNSWYPKRTDALWISTWNTNIAGFKSAWSRHEIPQVNWHWQMVSSKVNGAYTRDAWGKDAGGNQQMMSAQQWADIVTPGTALYDSMIEDVDYHITNFLKKIVDAAGPIPIIFRPLHEIDGGWFWWTCTSDPAKTAKLYQILQDRVINYHQMHNLIWVYNPGVLVDGGTWPPYTAAEYPRRRAFYAGDARCDIVGIDLYDWDWQNAGAYMPAGNGTITYRVAWNEVKAISATKMIALSECQGFPDPGKCFTDSSFAPWLYALPWYSDASNGVPCTILNTRVNDSHMINARDLPDFSSVVRVAPSAEPFNPKVWRVGGLRLPGGACGKITIVTMKGSVVGTWNNPDREVMAKALRDLPRGLYLVHAVSGSRTVTRKIVRE